MERYARQSVFSPIGSAGQEKLLGSKVAIVGMGALGTVSANNLCRAGVGHIRMVDRDYVELTNLQRQMIYNEEDARQSLPKAIAAFNHLSEVNSEITLEPVVADVNPSNIEHLIHDADLVLDATDNWETRLLINEACHALGIPWIYCGVLGAEGMTMNILPGEDNPCLRCFLPSAASNTSHSCSMFGVLNMITGAITCVQTTEAIKLLIGSDAVRTGLLTMDLWGNHINIFELQKNPDCPVCVHQKYEYYGKLMGSYSTSLCGSNAVQIVPAKPFTFDFHVLAEKLGQAGKVRFNEYAFYFSDGKFDVTLFQDGRAMIKNVLDENQAKSLFTELFG